jgi:uncharacterized protein (UPF0216 family)
MAKGKRPSSDQLAERAAVGDKVRALLEIVRADENTVTLDVFGRRHTISRDYLDSVEELIKEPKARARRGFYDQPD